MVSVDQIKKVLEDSLTNAKVTVHDMTGTSDHFQVQVVSSDFEGKNAVQRHRMVYDLFGTDVGNAIHALSIKALTPDEV
ncbi:BolA family transcriptional regulator [bacterium]|nr:BolA family transcriptional regulator [bacterium]